MNQKTIRNLRIENFQSHELTEMAFDDGLNVIVGPSDQGKSAVIRALRWLLFNEPRGSDFIRVGATRCLVSVELADGSRVTRERTPSRNRYLVMKPDGEEQIYEGFGNSVPQEVSAVTGVAKVMLDEDTETVLHLGTQLEPPFLLAETGSVKAKAIGRLNGVHIIDAASRDTHRDLTRANGEEKNLREQLAETEAELEQFGDVPYLENILLLVEDKQTALKQMSLRLARLQQLRRQYADVQAEISRTADVLNRTEHVEKAALQAERAILLHGKSLRLRQMSAKHKQVNQGITDMDRILTRTAQLAEAERRLAKGDDMLKRHRSLAQIAAARARLNETYRRVEAVLGQTEPLQVLSGKVERIEQIRQRLTSLIGLSGKLSETKRVLTAVDRVLGDTEQVPLIDGQFMGLKIFDA